MKRHIRDNYYVVGEGIYSRERGRAVCQRPSTTASLRKFRFSRMGPRGQALDQALANAMTPTQAAQPTSANPPVPAGFTYLGQFIDHDLTLDRTSVGIGENVTVDELLQGRSPALDLESLYGGGRNIPRIKVSTGMKFACGFHPTMNVGAIACSEPRGNAEKVTDRNLMLDGFAKPSVVGGIGILPYEGILDRLVTPEYLTVYLALVIVPNARPGL